MITEKYNLHGQNGLDANVLNYGFTVKSSGVYEKDGYTFKVDKNGKITIIEENSSEGFTLAELIETCRIKEGEYYIDAEDFIEPTGITQDELEEYIFNGFIDLTTDSPNLISFVEFYKIFMEATELYEENQTAAEEIIEGLNGKYGIIIEDSEIQFCKLDYGGPDDVEGEEVNTIIQTYGDVKLQLKTKDDFIVFYHDMGEHVDEDCNGICDICNEECYNDKDSTATRADLGYITYDLGVGNTASVVNVKTEKWRTNVNIPSTIKYLGQTYTVNSIGSYAFYDSRECKKVTIPSTVTSIATDAFSTCDVLETIAITQKTKDSISGAPWKGNGWIESVEPTQNCVRVIWSNITDYYVYPSSGGTGHGSGS